MPDNDTSNNDSGNNNQSGDNNPPAGGDAPKTLTLTQAALDVMINDRLARERKKFEGFDDLKDKATKFDELQNAQKDEVTRLNDELGTFKTKAEQAEARANRTLKRAAILEAAGKQGARSPSAVFKLLDLDALNVEGDEVLGVDEAVTKLLTDEPWLKTDKIKEMGSADGGTRTDGENNGAGTFSRSQIRDPRFYRANEKAIIAAFQAGQITDD